MAIGATCPATMARAMVVASCAGGCRCIFFFFCLLCLGPIMLEQVSRSTARLWLLPGLAAEATYMEGRELLAVIVDCGCHLLVCYWLLS
ncbi:unnamed protein product [Prunus armeniaca]|uniref:Uncharacterized protein n=1 Tax=Prunus armeniaca TaxID=36596 RepID=A0A6J5W3G7_PRUAR|nr:unnamed protein product [Prunus armeniaca]